MNCCKNCRSYGTTWNGFGKCRKRGWTTSDGYGRDCELFESPSKLVLHVPEPEPEPTSALLEKYRGERKD